MADVTVFDVLVGAMRKMRVLKVEKATGGSTTTVVVSGLADRGSDTGTMFILKADGAAPQCEFQAITAYDGTDTFTTAAFTAVVGAGDTVGWITQRYRIWELVSDFIEALHQLVPSIQKYNESLTTAASQLEYTLPQEIHNGNIRQVKIQLETGDSDANRWEPVLNWYVKEGTMGDSAPGADKLLCFYTQPATGRKLQIIYDDLHGDLDEASDVLSEGISKPVAVAALVAFVRTGEMHSSSGQQTRRARLAQGSDFDLQKALAANPIHKEPPRSTTRFEGKTRWP